MTNWGRVPLKVDFSGSPFKLQDSPFKRLIFLLLVPLNFMTRVNSPFKRLTFQLPVPLSFMARLNSPFTGWFVGSLHLLLRCWVGTCWILGHTADRGQKVPGHYTRAYSRQRTKGTGPLYSGIQQTEDKRYWAIILGHTADRGQKVPGHYTWVYSRQRTKGTGPLFLGIQQTEVKVLIKPVS